MNCLVMMKLILYDLAYSIFDMVNTNDYGIHHITNDGFCSWSDFSRQIFSISNKNTLVKDIYTSDYLTIAKRPLNSRMKKGSYKLRSWEEALEHYLKKELNYND